MRPDCKGAERVAVVGELVEPPAMEPKGGTLESRTKNGNWQQKKRSGRALKIAVHKISLTIADYGI